MKFQMKISKKLIVFKYNCITIKMVELPIFSVFYSLICTIKFTQKIISRFAHDV